MSATLSATLTVKRADHDARLLQELLRGDDTAFLNLVHREHASMLRYAALFVSDQRAAEVVREAWSRIITGLAQYRGISVRVWMFGVVASCAKALCVHSVTATALADDEEEQAVDPDRFFSPGSSNAGGWSEPPKPWPEDCARRPGVVELIRESIDSLPLLGRQIFFLRDVEGWSAEAVCALLGTTECRQRLLLHRARSRVRSDLECRFAA